jgi:tetratricopeptide (TPR) repeat protein
MSIRVASSSGFAVVSSLLILNIVPLAFASDAQWVEVRSPHFNVVTDAGEKRGRETALKFEQMRAVFGALLTKAKVNLPVPLQIVAFRNTKEFRQFAPLWQGKPTQLAGLFQAGPDRSFILLDMSVEDPWTVVFHEYAHQLLNGNITAETQLWFDEGFAEYFSTIEVDGKQVKLGKKPPPGDWEVLHQYGMMKVSDLFRVQHNSREYNEGDRRSVFYAESWLLVHYLYDTKQVAKLSPFFNAVIDRKVSIEDGIQQAFGMSAPQFDKTLREYMARGQVRYMSIPTPPGIEMTGYTVASIGVAGAKTVMADAHLHSMDYQDKAVNEFEEVLAIEPNNGAALRGLGYASLRKQDFQRAAGYFQKAMQADSKDPRVYYYSALLMNQEGSSARDAEKLATMKKELQTSLALDPDFADSYALLAYTQMSSGEHDEALESMKKALQLSPRNEQYLYNLSQIYLAIQRVDEAVNIMRGLESSRDPGIAATARNSMEQVAKMKIVLGAMSKPPEGGRVESASPDHDEPAKPNDTAAGNEYKPLPRDPHPLRFLKGKLMNVDCSADPAAVLTVMSERKTWKMRVADSKHVIVIGADNFSCGWTNQRVALNYRETSDGEGNVATVEIQ